MMQYGIHINLMFNRQLIEVFKELQPVSEYEIIYCMSPCDVRKLKDTIFYLLCNGHLSVNADGNYSLTVEV
jgi:hypothetical protein